MSGLLKVNLSVRVFGAHARLSGALPGEVVTFAMDRRRSLMRAAAFMFMSFSSAVGLFKEGRGLKS